MVNWHVRKLSWKNCVPLRTPLEPTANFVNHVVHRILAFSGKTRIWATLTACQSPHMTCPNMKILIPLNTLKCYVSIEVYLILIELLSYFWISGRYEILWISVRRLKDKNLKYKTSCWSNFKIRINVKNYCSKMSENHYSMPINR